MLNADQCGYVSGFLHTGTIIANAVLTVILLKLGAGVHLVKFVSAVVFITRPLALNIYGRKKYQIDRKTPKDQKSLSQKWDNFSQSIALYIHTKTDSVLITLLIVFLKAS